MKIKGRGILGLCLLGFGGFAVYDYYKTEKKDSQDISDSRLMTLNYEQIEKIEIHRDIDQIILQRSPEGWKFESPLEEMADKEAAEKFVKDIYPERILDTAMEGPQIDWSLYDLAPAFATITLTDAQGEKNSFHISAKKNFEGNIFARRNEENKVLVLNSSWDSRSRKNAIDFRDRRVFKQPLAAIDEITLSNNHGTFSLHRLAGKWQVRGYKIDLDQNKVREFLKTLSDAKFDEVSTAQSIPSGFTPLFEVVVRAADQKWTAKAAQSQGEDKKIFLFSASANSWMRLEPGALDLYISKGLKTLEVTAVEKETQPADPVQSSPKENDEKNPG